jgi:molecular chaperone GrpE (heat shock protein)
MADDVKVEDKRFWARKDDEASDTVEASNEPENSPTRTDVDPAELEAVRRRAEGAERKLQEIQAAFMAAKTDLENTRERLVRDAEKKIEIRFGDLVADLLESVDDLDRAIEHAESVTAAAPILHGVAIARERFLNALQKAGVERIDPLGDPYDPNIAEAIGIVPVSEPEKHDRVTTIARAGYKLGGRIIRPARVLVGRLAS